MQREFPGLTSKGFVSTGKFGIGFFSIFMLGDRVEVVTRRSSEAQDHTRVLEFARGVGARPLLRFANEEEQLLDGGTRVRVRLDGDPRSEGGLLHALGGETRSLPGVCGSICPAIDASLHVTERGERTWVVRASDWLSLDSKELMLRVWNADETQVADRDFEIAARNVRSLRNELGQVVGRASICDIWRSRQVESRIEELEGAVVAGGLTCNRMQSIQGVLVGEPTRAARDAGQPVVSREELMRWASDQANLLSKTVPDEPAQIHYASIVRRCGGSTGDLIVAEGSGGYMSLRDVGEWASDLDEIIIVNRYAVTKFRIAGVEISLYQNVLSTDITPLTLLFGTYEYYSYLDWPQFKPEVEDPAWRSISGSLAASIIHALAVHWSSPLEDVVKASNLWEDGDGIAIGARASEPVIERRALIVRRPDQGN